MIRIEHILSEFQQYTGGKIDCSPIQKAYVLAAKVQSPVKFFRASYLETALEVAKVLTESRMDIQTIVSGILHGIYLENKITVEEIKDLMGSDTATIVKTLGEILKIPGEEKDFGRRKAQTMRQMIFASSVDIRVIFVNLAVQLVRLRHYRSFFSGKDEETAKETMETYAPIADRFGLSHIKVEMEDLSLMLMYPKVYKDIQEFCSKKKAEHLEFLEKTTLTISERLKRLQVEGEVKGRIKHFHSIYRKAQKYNVEFENIHDLLGFRVITEDVGDCYKVLGMIHEMFQPVAERFKDYISFPKPNGYQSLHTMVFDAEGIGFEVQIRTKEMDQVAELGIAAHWAYKADSLVASDQDKNTAWLTDLTKSLNVTTDPRESLDIFTRELFSDFVYVFTPKGKIIKLPVGSTVIDFAYEIHSEIGNSCVGAMVNGKHSSIKTMLRQGDNVEILTAKNQQPSTDWLRFAVTTRALSQIRLFLRKKEKQEALGLGKELFNEELSKLHMRFKDVENSEKLKKFLDRSGYRNLEEYYSQLGFGKANVVELDHYLIDKVEQIPQNLRQKITKPFSKKREGVRIAGIENIMVRYANCCNPVKGEQIIGVVTRGQGVSIHLKNCENLKRQDIIPERLVEVEWIKNSQEKLPVRLNLEFNEQIKTSLQILKVLTSAKAVLLESNLRLVKNVTHQDLLVKIDDLEQLEKILKKLNAIPTVKAHRKIESQTPN